MADSNIGSLPQAANLDDDSLLVAEQQGQAMKVTGAQFKEFGRQAVIGQVQGYVDQAADAADRAVAAVSAVTEMTVEASTLPSGQNATVTRSTKNGKVNLAFGLPRGERGEVGPAGQTGPRGPQGPTGKGLTILGYYDTQEALEAAVPAPAPGDAYGVGTEAPYDIYIFDGESRTWKNNGPLSGGGGGPLPENVVTAEGGASMTFPLAFGDGPHTITFTDEEEPPLTAEDISYDGSTVKKALDGLKSSVSDGKALVASAITDKGIPTAQDATFQQMADNIGSISTGSDTSDATATSFDILAPKTAYTASGKVEGTIPTLLGRTIVPGTADKTIAGGQYLGGTQTIKGEPNLTSSNIKKGVTLFGVEGALESKFQAVLTVTADAGAVVTATHSDGTQVEGLSQTGTVVLDLPKEGTWKVTAVRGVAQYNTVTINVTSSYNAALTAAAHIEYYGRATSFPYPACRLSAATVGNQAVFAGGSTSPGAAGEGSRKTYAYDENLTFVNAPDLTRMARDLCGAAVGDFIFFAGGYSDFYTNYGPYFAEVDTYTSALTKGTVSDLSTARAKLSGASIGDHVIFGGGTTGAYSAVVDAYNKYGSKVQAVNLSLPMGNGAAASNKDYAVFCGGNSATAYDKNMAKVTISKLNSSRTGIAAAQAGNYVLIAGGGNEVDAYDAFLTRTSAEILSASRYNLAGTALNGYAIFAGKNGYSESISGTDIYDAYLVKTTAKFTDSFGIDYLAASSVGNYALFGGGGYVYQNESRFSSAVYVYQHV